MWCKFKKLSKYGKALLFIFLVFLSVAFSTTVKKYVFAVDGIDSIEISPSLDITRFAPYKALASVSGTPDSVSVDVRGINGQLAPSDPAYWEYYVDGTPETETYVKPMTYNATSGKWESPIIRPDDIYPEIIFGNKSLTWYTAPSDSILQRNSYKLMHFSNPFTMVGDMSFYIEVNALARAANSADLSVYLVKKGKTAAFFNSDWRSSVDVELMGSVSSGTAFNHSHTSNSSHHLVAVSTNPDGTVGAKNLDISGDFWVVLYSSSPNNARGWNLRYHPSCNGRGRYYDASQSGWTVSAQAGCPDVHTHLARRGATLTDGVKVTVTADFGGSSVSSSESFYFGTPPNLPPNQTTFISPVVGGVYDGGGSDQIAVSWNPASDPNGDPLRYSIHLLDGLDQTISVLASNVASNSFVWDISAVANGTYKLKGITTEDKPSGALSTEFVMPGTFTIEKTVPPLSLSSVSIVSNNPAPSFAKAGDVVTLSFTASGVLDSPSVAMYSGGEPVTGTVSLTGGSGNSWSASYEVASGDTDGIVGFTVSAANLDQNYSNSTNGTFVLVDVTAPGVVTAVPDAGTYSSPQSVTLNSSGADSIRYSLDGSLPHCGSGETYASAVAVSSPAVLRAIACDSAGNSTTVFAFSYAFRYTVIFNANGGSGHEPPSVQVDHGSTAVMPTDPVRAGHAFAGWNTASDGSGSTFGASTTVVANVTVYAQWTANRYDVTYFGNGNDSGSVPGAVDYEYGNTIYVSDSGTLGKGGYSFNGWNTASDGSGVYYSAGQEVTVVTDLDLYAQWTENSKCTVTFNGNGGSGQAPGSRTVDCGQSLSGSGSGLPSSPSRTGYSFASWNVAINGSGATFDGDTVINSNLSVYAQWTGVTYTVTFDAQGGSVSPGSAEVVYGSPIGTLPTPTRPGYIFISWNSSADGNGTMYQASTVYAVAEGITLYAQWAGNQYYLAFDPQGGSGSSTITVTYGSAVGSLPTPAKTGHAFMGWYTEPSGQGILFTSATVYTETEGQILSAAWQVNNYALEYFASANGHIAGQATQSVAYGEYGTAVQAVPNGGYRFHSWSDGRTSNPRTDRAVAYDFTVGANFIFETTGSIPGCTKFPSGKIVVQGDAKTTGSRTVDISLEEKDSVDVVLGENPLFPDAKYTPVFSKRKFELSEGEGVKTVFAKLRSSCQQAIVLSDSIEYVLPDIEPVIRDEKDETALRDPEPAGPLPDGLAVGDLVMGRGLTTVYLVDEDNRLHPFPNESVYFSWVGSYERVRKVPSDLLDAAPLGGNVVMRPGTYLVKSPLSPKVYAVESYGVLRWLVNEGVASMIYGDDWSKRVVDLDPAWFGDYQKGSDVKTLTYPAGSLLSDDAGTRAYVSEEGVALSVTEDVFENNLFRDGFVIRKPDSEAWPEIKGHLPALSIERMVALRE